MSADELNRLRAQLEDERVNSQKALDRNVRQIADLKREIAARSMSEDEKTATDHLVRGPSGQISRCPACGSYLWALFLKKKFDEIVQENVVCPVCTVRELNTLKHRP